LSYLINTIKSYIKSEDSNFSLLIRLTYFRVNWV